MAYLTVAEYIDRYGERETTLLTNEDVPIGGGAATYDSQKVEGAIDDAVEEVEGFVSRRYTTPLASPPRIVKGWVAAIARLKLAETSGRVSDAIKDAADRVYKQLAQLVANQINLPIEEGDTPPAQVGSGSPLVSGDRASPTFGPGVMDSFTAPFTGCYNPLPSWMRGS